MKRNSIFILILCIALPLLLGFIAGQVTRAEIVSWYITLNKPSFNPPNWIFFPVWTMLYLLMGISSYMIWREANSPQRTNALRIYGLQLLLNFLWSVLFFGMHSVGLALVDIFVLWLLIIAMIILFKRIRPLSGYMQIPYLLWVSFATLLTASIFWLN